MTKPFLYIECVGLPGSGKTTFCRKFMANHVGDRVDNLSLAWKNVTPRDKVVLAWRGLSDLALWATILSWLLVHGMVRSRDATRRLVKLPFQKALLKKLLQKQSVLLDQGFLQSLWSAAVSAGYPPVNVDGMIDALYAGVPSRFLAFEVKADICADRIAKRTDGASRFDGRSTRDVYYELERSRNFMTQLNNAVADRAITLDASRDAENVYKKAQNFVANAADKLKITYVFMRYPVPREAFAQVDIKTLGDMGHAVDIYGLRDVPFKSLLRGIFNMALRPFLTVRAIKWVMAQSRDPRHVAKALSLFPALFFVLHRINKNDPDIVHVFWGHYPSTLLWLLNTVKNRAARSMFLGAYDLNTRWPGSVHAASNAHAIFTHARVNIPELDRLGVPANRVDVVYRGIAVNDKQKIMDTVKKPASFLMAAAFVKSKRHDIALDVFSAIYARKNTASLTLCGDGVERNVISNNVSKLNVSHAVRMTGHLPHPKLFAEMTSHRYFILPTEHENERLPNAVKEAMLHGCIVLTTATPGIEELITHGENGFIVSFDDKAAIAKLFEKLESDPALRQKIIDNAYEKIITEFDTHKTMQRYVDVWKRAGATA